MPSSIHIQKTSNGSVAHNDRTVYSHSSVFTDEKNELINDSKKAFEIYRKELKVRSNNYTNRTNQKLQEKAITHLSAIVNLEKHHTLDDLKPLVEHLEKTLDTKVFQVAIHRDEGKIEHKESKEMLASGIDFFYDKKSNRYYYDKDYSKELDITKFNIIKNYHSHIEFMGLDSEGGGIKRNKLSKYYLIQLQDFTAETLKMERGRNRAKRLDTHEFKRAKVEENRVIKRELATQKDLKNVNNQLREQLKESKQAHQKDYQNLKSEIDTLKTKIKEKDLTITELESFKSDYENRIPTLESKNIELEKEVTKYKALYQDRDLVLVNTSKLRQINRRHKDELEKKEKEAKEREEEYKKSQLEQQRQHIEASENFKKRVKALNEELNTLQEIIKELKEQLESLQGQNKALINNNNDLQQKIDSQSNIEELEREDSSKNILRTKAKEEYKSYIYANRDEINIYYKDTVEDLKDNDEYNYILDTNKLGISSDEYSKLEISSDEEYSTFIDEVVNEIKAEDKTKTTVKIGDFTIGKISDTQLFFSNSKTEEEGALFINEKKELFDYQTNDFRALDIEVLQGVDRLGFSYDPKEYIDNELEQKQKFIARFNCDKNNTTEYKAEDIEIVASLDHSFDTMNIYKTPKGYGVGFEEDEEIDEFEDLKSTLELSGVNTENILKCDNEEIRETYLKDVLKATIELEDIKDVKSVEEEETRNDKVVIITQDGGVYAYSKNNLSGEIEKMKLTANNLGEFLKESTEEEVADIKEFLQDRGIELKKEVNTMYQQRLY
jgi:hypothetical protein